MHRPAPTILAHLQVLGDSTRTRLLLLLDRRELTVSELRGIVQLPQSTVSRHLKALLDAGWIVVRADGTSHLYTLTRDALDGTRRRLWLLVREQFGATTAANQDQRRLETALAARRTASEEFFSSSAGQWDRLRDDLFGDRFRIAALAALADGCWTIGDLGCGTGHLSALMAPFAARLIAVDSSAAMLQAAKKQLHGFDNVDLRRGDLESLPIDDGRLDVAMLMLVLHHVPDPRRALGEVARVLKPDGRAIVVDMLPHDRDSYRQQMGHIWLGFHEDHVNTLLHDSGFGSIRVVPLPADPKAKGPGLFVASARKHSQTSSALHDAPLSSRTSSELK